MQCWPRKVSNFRFHSSILDHEKFRRVPDGWGYLEPFCEGRETVEELIPV